MLVTNESLTQLGEYFLLSVGVHDFHLEKVDQPLGERVDRSPLKPQGISFLT